MEKQRNNAQITLDTVVCAKELAIVLGLTTRRIQQLVQDGIFEPVQKGKYSLTKSIERYIGLITKEATEPDRQRETAEIEIKKAKAIVAVMEAQELQGKMHRSEDVAAMTEDLIYTMRGVLMALPGRLAVDVTDVSLTSEAANIIRKEVYKVMGELANYKYDPKKYEERVRERQNWGMMNGREGDDE